MAVRRTPEPFLTRCSKRAGKISDALSARQREVISVAAAAVFSASVGSRVRS
jgi:hypothetical protein